jgi:hypothetical protein
VFLPAHLLHDLGQRGAILALKKGHHLGCLAAFARPAGFRRGSFLWRLLRPGRLGGRVYRNRPDLGRVCANVGYGFGSSGLAFRGGLLRSHLLARRVNQDFLLGLNLNDGGLRLGVRNHGLRSFSSGLRLNRSKVLNCLPDALGRDLAIRKLGDGVDARNAIPNLNQAVRRPFGGQFRQFALAGERIKRGGRAAASFLLANTVMLLSVSMVNVFI